MSDSKVLFIKPPDRFLDNEFVYQQLGPHYLQSYLAQHNIASDMLVLYEPDPVRKSRTDGSLGKISLDQLNMLLIKDGSQIDVPFDKNVFGDYSILGLSVMSPQAPDSYLLSGLINKEFPHLTTVIGGSHPRYYLSSVKTLPEEIAFDFVVPYEGWNPMLDIASGNLKKGAKSQVLIDQPKNLQSFPAPSRPLELMEKYNFNIAGVPAFHTITALGCPFSCNFCESGRESVRRFSDKMISLDLENMAQAHRDLGRDKYSVMFFDDVGLMTPQQVEGLSQLVSESKFTTWRAFTHAYLVVKHNERLLKPFYNTGGRRIGMGLETGSQRSLDMINKRNGQKQNVYEHYDAVRIANDLGIAVDAFTMIYPWEDESDLKATTELIQFVIANPVKGLDEQGRPLKNYVDSSIMTPYQGTRFNEMIGLGQIENVEMIQNMDPGMLFYKGNHGGSGWPYKKTRLPKERYEEEQEYRNSLRPKYR